MPPRKKKTKTAPKRKRDKQPDTQAEEEAAAPERPPAVTEEEEADRPATPASSGHSTDGNGDEEQQQEQDPVPRPKPRGKGKKVLPVTQLPELKDKAEEIIEWWMSYPQLYDKTKLAYHDVVKKKDIITTKAVELGVSFDVLKRWMTHYRDEYYKIMNKVEQAERSGAGLDDVRLTERERWIYDHLGWLKVHHQPQKKRTVVGLGPEPQTQRQPQEAEEEGDTQEPAPQDDPQPDDEPEEGAVRPPSAAGSATSAASAAARGRKKAPAVLTPSQVNLAVATQVRAATQGMQDRVAGLVNRMATRDASPDHQWGRWLGSVSDELHPDMQQEWQDRTFAVAQDFRERSRELYRREAQQLPMPLRQPQAPALPQTAGTATAAGTAAAWTGGGLSHSTFSGQ